MKSIETAKYWSENLFFDQKTMFFNVAVLQQALWVLTWSDRKTVCEPQALGRVPICPPPIFLRPPRIEAACTAKSDC